MREQVEKNPVEIPIELLESGIHEMEKLDPVNEFSDFLTKWGRWMTILFHIRTGNAKLVKKESG